MILAPLPTQDLALLLNTVQFTDPVMALVFSLLASSACLCSASAVAQEVNTNCGMPKLGGAKCLNSAIGSRKPSMLKPASQVTSSGW